MIEIIKPRIVRVKDEETDSYFGRFVVEPLEKGFGVTLGNSIRRTLLSSIPGFAVTSVKIDGVLHEFQVIEGLREDMIEVGLNLKNIIAELDEDVESYTCHVKKSGKTVLKAGDFEAPGNVKIINKDHVIANIDRDNEINFYITISKGHGYKTAAAVKAADENVDLTKIYLDADFSPVKRVNYSINETRIGQNYDYEILALDIWTDGSILAEPALNTAVRILQEYLNFFVTIEDFKVETVGMLQEKEETTTNSYDVSVRELEFSVRSRNCLKRANIKTLGQLTELSADDLLSIKNFGRKSLYEIRDKLKQYSLSLKGEEDFVDDDFQGE
ncbi:DNA-directed RNA polymerase subunit alpha [bacterium]|nr:DNA-directed RNA polymerase subunit alpha [bacterium]